MNKEILGNLLREALNPEFLEIDDRTEAHSGHASSGDGGHYELRIVSSQFVGLAPLARHRLVNTATDPVRQEIHALSIKAYSPEEFAAQNQPKTPRPTIALNVL
jgi:BolA protein